MCLFREDTQDFWFRDRALEDDQSCIQWVLVCSICRAIPYPCNEPVRSSVFKTIKAKVPCQTSGLPFMDNDHINTPIGKQ